MHTHSLSLSHTHTHTHTHSLSNTHNMHAHASTLTPTHTYTRTHGQLMAISAYPLQVTQRAESEARSQRGLSEAQRMHRGCCTHSLPSASQWIQWICQQQRRERKARWIYGVLLMSMQNLTPDKVCMNRYGFAFCFTVNPMNLSTTKEKSKVILQCIVDVYARLHTWQGLYEQIREYFCTDMDDMHMHYCPVLYI